MCGVIRAKYTVRFYGGPEDGREQTWTEMPPFDFKVEHPIMEFRKDSKGERYAMTRPDRMQYRYHLTRDARDVVGTLRYEYRGEKVISDEVEGGESHEPA